MTSLNAATSAMAGSATAASVGMIAPKACETGVAQTGNGKSSMATLRPRITKIEISRAHR